MDATKHDSHRVLADRLWSERLELVAGELVGIDPIWAFLHENRDHLAAWQPVSVSREWLKDEMAACESRKATERRYFLRLRTDLGAPSEVIGYVFLTRIHHGATSSCELSYALDHRHLGRGLVTEACRRALDYAFEELGMDRVDAKYVDGNEASARVLDRLGFHTIGIAPRYAFIAGDMRDHVLMFCNR